MAMEAEASPIVSNLSLVHDATFFPITTPFKAFSGFYKDCNVVVITNGKDHVHGTGVDNCGTVPAGTYGPLASIVIMFPFIN